jgi:hypothetical protein
LAVSADGFKESKADRPVRGIGLRAGRACRPPGSAGDEFVPLNRCRLIQRAKRRDDCTPKTTSTISLEPL